jgi:glycosyltransferase involved in cell wall biosynthesis
MVFAGLRSVPRSKELVVGVKLSIVSEHIPLRGWMASGQTLYAVCTGLIALGHEVDVWAWNGAEPPVDPPPWCHWAPLPEAAMGRWAAHARALVSPRTEVLRGTWTPASGAVVVAFETLSWPAAAEHRPAAVVIDDWTAFDDKASGTVSLHSWQDRRADRRAVRQADLVLTGSDRVAAAVGVPATSVPLAFAPPDQAMALVEEPVAALLVDGRWPPNQTALRSLLECWPEVRMAVPAARLLLAGRHLDAALPPTRPDGVEILGEVGDPLEVLEQTAAMAFPSPSSSGPKIKVFEAMAHGVPVVTTEWGVEGIRGVDGVVEVATLGSFGARLAAVLADPDRRAIMASGSRGAMLEHHAPIPVARAWVEALSPLARRE